MNDTALHLKRITRKENCAVARVTRPTEEGHGCVDCTDAADGFESGGGPLGFDRIMLKFVYNSAKMSKNTNMTTVKYTGTLFSEVPNHL